MIILTIHLVAMNLCSKKHRQPVSMQSIDTFIGQAYEETLWSNCPIKGGPG